MYDNRFQVASELEIQLNQVALPFSCQLKIC